MRSCFLGSVWVMVQSKEVEPIEIGTDGIPDEAPRHEAADINQTGVASAHTSGYRTAPIPCNSTKL